MGDRFVRRDIRSAWFVACLAGLVFTAGVFCNAVPVAAQAILMTVNGYPITNTDVDERMKLLRVLRKPASHDQAVESLIDERLKVSESSKYGVKVGDGDLAPEISRVATQLKMTPEALFAAFQHAGISNDHAKSYFGAFLSFNYLVQALNKGVEASETLVREELAKQGGRNAAGYDYTVRQVIFSVPSNASVADVNARGHAAEQFRSRFTNCQSGLEAARNLPDVAVREQITRNSTQLSDGLRDILEKTPVGHLTPPQRNGSGLEMIAVCAKSASKDDSTVRASISAKIVAARLDTEGERRLKELRTRAVIVRK